MEPLSSAGGQELIWQPIKRFARNYTLRSGEALYATLQWPSAFRIRAAAETADGQWVFIHKGFLRSLILAKNAATGSEVGRFPTARPGSILTVADGKTFNWRLGGLLRAESTWLTEQGVPVLRCNARHWNSARAQVFIEPSAVLLPELPLLVTLGWYTQLMMFAGAGALAL